MSLPAGARPVGYRQRMPLDAPREGGPWGNAIEFWLKERRLSQAELLRRINAERHDIAATDAGTRKSIGPKAKRMGPNTISRITRGFHTQTRLLAVIAKHLAVPIEEVLVSPTHRHRNEDSEQLMSSMADLQRQLENARRIVEANRRLQPDPVTLEIAKRLQRLSPKLRASVLNVIADYEQATRKGRRGGTKRRKKAPPTT